MSDQHRFLLGRIAVEHQLITEDQLQKCIDIQRSASKPTRLGQVLLDLGYVNRNQLKFLEAKQTQRLEETDVFQNRPVGEVLFGKLVVQLGFCLEAHVNECLREAAIREAEGQDARLGELLVQKGYLSPYQLNMVLAEQNKKILFCATCEKHFNILGFKRGYRLRCIHCETTLVPPREKFAVGAAEELFFDEERAENVALLGQIAIKSGLLEPDQIDKALEHQEEVAPEKSIGQILVELGFLSPPRLEELLAMQAETQARKKLLAERRSRETLLGQLAVREGLASDEMINRALMTQTREQAEGKRRRIGAILVEHNFLTEPQVLRLLETQGRRIFACPKCARQYNLIAHGGQDVLCPDCKAELEAPEEIVSLEVADDVYVGEEELSVVELEAMDEAVSGEIHSTRRMFREFYAREGMDESKAAADDGGPELVPLDVARKLLQTRKAQEEVARHRWLVPALGASLLGLAAVVSIVGYLVTRPEPAPPGVDPAGGSNASTPLPADPVDGDAVLARGLIPAGELERVAVLEREVQLFLVFVRPGEAYWIVDPKGESFDRLQYLAAPQNLAVEKSVQARGTFRSRPPEGVTLPIVSGVKGYVFAESWAPIPSGLPDGGSLQVLRRPE